MRVGSGASDPASDVYYAPKLGLFAKRGLNVDVQPFTSGGAQAAAVAGGSIDVGESNVLSIANAHLRGIPFLFIAPAAQYSSAAPTSVLICAKDALYRTGADLNGKTVSVSALGDSSQLGPMAWSESTGGDPDSLRFVELPASEMPAAIIRGSIDAVRSTSRSFTPDYRPARSAFWQRCLMQLHHSFCKTDGLLATKWVAANRNTAAAFSDAIMEAGRWVNRNRKASLEILKERSRIDPEVMATMNRAVFAERFDPKLLQPMIDSAARYKLIERSFPASDLVAKLR